MFKRNKFYTAVIASALITSSALISAQETVTSTATVTVQNAFDLAEIAALNFGTIRATQNLNVNGSTADGPITTPATIVVKSNGTANTTTTSTPAGTNSSSAISELIAGTPGEYAITNAAPFTNLTVSVPGSIELKNPSAPTDSYLEVRITRGDMTVKGGGNDGDQVNTDGDNLLTDTNGAVGLMVGGTININDAATRMPDGVYTGTYVIEVQY